MPVFPRVLLMLVFAAWAGQAAAATTTSTKSKSKSSSKTATKSAGKTTGSGKKETSSKAGEKSAAKAKENETVKKKEEAPPELRPAAVSSVSVEEIAGFDQYPKQVQSLVQSALALTHLELRYLYGSHEPSNGGMDCSGTIYHVLKFQGLKDVPRQSDEMAMWVDKKTWLHLTPTATSFDSPEFEALKPGDLVFWTNTIETSRKLPVTHVMIYLGKLKKDGKRVVFGASDGRSYSGQRRSGVSVFDFNLPKPEGTARLHGYGRAPGLMPAEDVILAAAKMEAAAKAEEAVKDMAATDAATAANDEAAGPTSAPTKAEPAEQPKPKNEAMAKEPAVATNKPDPATDQPAKEEVRKAVSVGPDTAETKGEKDEEFVPAYKKKVRAAELTTKSKPGAAVSETKAEEPKKAVSSSTGKTKSNTASKPRSSSSTPQKKSTNVSTRKRTPPSTKSAVGQSVDRAVNSVRRLFQ